MKHTNKVLLVLALSSLSISSFAGELPNPQQTPGALNPAVTQANIHETICHKGYSASIRSPLAFTSKLKREQIGPSGNMRDYEEDDLVSLALGGMPKDKRNLWAQPRFGEWNAEKKDAVEYKLIGLVCFSGLPLATAQQALATNWIEAYKKYGGEKYLGGKSGSNEAGGGYHSSSMAHVATGMVVHHMMYKAMRKMF